MDTLGMISYTVSVISLFMFMIERNVLITDLKRRFFAGRNKLFVRIIGPNKREVEAFVNFKDDYLKIGSRVYVKNHEKQTLKDGSLPFDCPSRLVPLTADVWKDIKASLKAGEIWKGNVHTKIDANGYVLDEQKSTYKGKYPVFTYRYDNPEPLDLFEEYREIPMPEESLVIPGKPMIVTCSSCNAENKIQIPDTEFTTPQRTVNVFGPKPIDNSLYDIIIQKVYGLGKLKDKLKSNQMLTYFLIGAIAAAAVAAYFGYMNYTTLQKLVQGGTALKG